MQVIIGNEILSEKKQQNEKLALCLLGDVTISEVLHLLRRRLGIKQFNIAKQANIQPGLLSLCECGTIILPDDDIEKILLIIKEILETKESEPYE